MKSLRMQPNRSLHFLEIPTIPTPGPNEVLIRMAYASICGYDMMMLNGRAAYPYKGMIGHEGSGVVAAVGSEVRSSELRVGDRVTILPYGSCGQCDACRSNHPEYCVNPGGRADLMTEYVCCDKQRVFHLPDTLSLQAGSLIEPLMMAMHAVDKAKLHYGSSVLLLGCGAMGQIILKLIRQHPVGRIVVVEPMEEKREQAKKLGADLVLDANDSDMLMSAIQQANGGMGYDSVLEVSGSRSSAQMALNMVARGGSVVYFGLYGMDFNLEVNLFNLYWKDANITAVCVPSGQFPAALNMAPVLKLEEVVTGVFPFSEAIQAFEEKATGRHAKVMLKFDQQEEELPW